jgi:hypothetical protein
MTEVGGYRTLAQLGAASPHALTPADGTAPPARPDSPQPDVSFLPPAHTMVPTNRPGGPQAPPSFAPASRGAELVRPSALDPNITLQPGSDLTNAGIWNVPFTPLTLPTPTRLVREGIELIRDWHPRDPSVRLSGHPDVRDDQPPRDGIQVLPMTPISFDGESTAPTDQPATTEPAPAPAPAPAAEPASSGSQRSDAAKLAMMIGLGGGFAQNAIDVVRLVKKYPEALRAGKFDPSLGRMGRLPTALGLTALTRPDNRILDPTWRGMAASVETGGRTFDAFDDIAMKSSVLLGASLAAIQIGSSIPNLVDALGKDGPWYENLAQTTSGRAGVLQLAGGTLGAAVFATAIKQTAGQAGPGIVSKVLTAGSAPIMARPVWGRIGLATGAVVMANELGYLDFLNTGETRSVGTVLSDAAHKTPVINDPEWRTAAILGAGGIVGFKAQRAIAAAGGLSGLGKGHIIGGAIVAGLLGVQLLGGLSGLNKPAAPAAPAAPAPTAPA